MRSIMTPMLFATRSAVAILSLSLTAASIAQVPDQQGPASVLAAYKSAVERLDIAGVEKLFAPDAVIIESGKVEGNFEAYRDHHLGPELKEFKSFSYSDYKVQIRLEGPVAVATETYIYRIVLKSDEVIERAGAASSVLKWDGRSWQIVSTHSSSRRPRDPGK